MLVSIVLLCLCANLYFHEVKWRQGRRRGRGGRREDMALTDGNTHGRTTWTNRWTNTQQRKTHHTLTWMNFPADLQNWRSLDQNQWNVTAPVDRKLTRWCWNYKALQAHALTYTQHRNHDVLLEAVNLPGNTQEENELWVEAGVFTWT